MNVLIIEDDKKLGDFLRRGLSAEGYATTLLESGEEALSVIRKLQPDLIILDRMLPGHDGLQICREVRSLKLPSKILILSALSEVEERVRGLRLGADDYLGKPFHFEELLARIQAIGNRDHRHDEGATLRYADLTLNLDTLEVQRAGKKATFTAKELKIIELLMRNPHRVLSRERILNNVWGMSEDPLTNVVDVYMARIRRKIDDGHEVKLIRTRRGLGYVLIDDSAAQQPDRPSPA
ncbi:MAG: response regulator transcription factor [Rhodocyclaceae bacterium]